MEENVMSHEEQAFLQTITEKTLDVLRDSFDPEIFRILDDPEAKKKDIEQIKDRLSPQVAAKIIGIANVFFYARAGGDINCFFDAVLRIGTNRTKAFIMFFALFSSIKDKALAARGLAISLWARLIASDMELKPSFIEKAELGGLFLLSGRILMSVYEFLSEEDLPKEFVEKNHHLLGLVMIEKFSLPDFLKEIIKPRGYLLLSKKGFSIPGIIELASSWVEKSFKEKGKLFIGPNQPDLNDAWVPMINEYFGATDLGKYLVVVD